VNTSNLPCSPVLLRFLFIFAIDDEIAAYEAFLDTMQMPLPMMLEVIFL
jgi:hypothetical protein